MENKYSVAVAWSEDDGGFIATVPEFPGLSAFGGTKEQALEEAEVALELFIEDMLADGETLPDCKQKNSYSGNIRLRIPKSTHQQVAELAESEGVSMNTMISTLLTRSLSEKRTVQDICEHLSARLSEMVASQRPQTKVYVSRSAIRDHLDGRHFPDVRTSDLYYTAQGVEQ
jgi:predicted RNase H-like HicB family nuclease/antitoxin component of RelBE/YafQ-DinJ toxin-antitoxin module